MKSICALCFVLIGLVSPAVAQETAATPDAQRLMLRLKIGDPCPELKVEKFIKGEPLPQLERGRVYVIEFWATWCGPCIEQMPHLSELQAEYRNNGVTIIGTNIREMRQVEGGWMESFDEQTLNKVESFVESQGDNMAYTVAYDGPSKSMDNSWMIASGNEAMPVAFVVDRSGTVAWIGHPMVLRMPLQAVANNTWDTTSGPQQVKQAENTYIDAMKLMSTDAQGGLLAWNQAEQQYPILAKDLAGPKFKAMIAADLCDDAFAVGKALVETSVKRNDAATLNSVAWSIVDPNAHLSRRDLDLAIQASLAANELTADTNPYYLDTLARVYFSQGETDKAVETQTRAVHLATEPLKSQLTTTLDEYRQQK